MITIIFAASFIFKLLETYSSQGLYSSYN